MMKIVKRIVIMTLIGIISFSMTGCGSSSSGGGQDLNDAKTWDFDDDGSLNAREREKYGDYLNDAYNYGK